MAGHYRNTIGLEFGAALCHNSQHNNWIVGAAPPVTGRDGFMLRRLLGAGVVVALLVVSMLSSASAEDGSGDSGEVTLVVGLTQPWETLNPVIGYAVPEYEVWNIQYTGLTSRADGRLQPNPRSGRILGGERPGHQLHLHSP